MIKPQARARNETKRQFRGGEPHHVALDGTTS
jgi:hypothetical protein